MAARSQTPPVPAAAPPERTVPRTRQARQQPAATGQGLRCDQRPPQDLTSRPQETDDHAAAAPRLPDPAVITNGGCHIQRPGQSICYTPGGRRAEFAKLGVWALCAALGRKILDIVSNCVDQSAQFDCDD